MPRHVHDDFSFLPTVDSTDEEIIEREDARQQTGPRFDEPIEEQPVVASPPPVSIPASPTVVNKETAPTRQSVATPKAAEEAPLPIPRAPEAVRFSDEKRRGPVETPAVSLSGRRAVEKAVMPVTPAPMSTGKAQAESMSRVKAPTATAAKPKPFIAPNPSRKSQRIRTRSKKHVGGSWLRKSASVRLALAWECIFFCS